MRKITLSFFCLRVLFYLVVIGPVLCDLGIQARAGSTSTLWGYYMTFMRMPVMDLADWKDSLDCIVEDGANTVILWMGGGFRSKELPITWAYNKEHKNVEKDFARELISHRAVDKPVAFCYLLRDESAG